MYTVNIMVICGGWSDGCYGEGEVEAGEGVWIF